MKSTLLRTGSNPIQELTRSTSGSLLSNGSIPSSPRISFRSSSNGLFSNSSIKRSSSDTDMIRSEYSISRVGRVGSVSFPDMGMIVEEEFSSIGFGNGNRKGKGKGNGNDHKFGFGGKGNNDHNEKIKLGEYYLQMIKSNPGDSLLLRNYGKYLHEVEKNAEKAEEYYGRAILANPGDGELLSLYGNLIWETQKDEDRAQSYFNQAVNASPDDCMVLGSYAHFLWEAEDEDDCEEINQAPAMVGAY